MQTWLGNSVTGWSCHSSLDFGLCRLSLDQPPALKGSAAGGRFCVRRTSLYLEIEIGFADLCGRAWYSPREGLVVRALTSDW